MLVGLENSDEVVITTWEHVSLPEVPMIRGSSAISAEISSVLARALGHSTPDDSHPLMMVQDGGYLVAGKPVEMGKAGGW